MVKQKLFYIFCINWVLGICLVFLSGCGWLSDADRIVIARMNDRVIRREDLKNLLREMLPEERPFIKSRGDLLRVLNSMIDKIIKEKLADQLAKEGKLDIPREWAAQQFDIRFPNYLNMIQNYDKLGLSEADKASLEQEREMRIDKVEKELRGEFALRLKLKEELENGTLEITDEELQQEYELRKEELKHFERIRFQGILFPVSQPDASSLAAEAQKRMKEGENPQDIIAEYAALGKGIPIASVLENDPLKASRYGPFWMQASGARLGDVIGPVYVRGWERVVENPDGEKVSEPIPDAFLVCKVLESVPPSPKTFEQAKNDLRPIVGYAKLMKRLREENGVVIYENKLPDPASYGTSGPRSIFDT